MIELYIDESGYTGYELLNKHQPYQGASSLMIDEHTAKLLSKKYFPNIQSQELKHQKLSRRSSNWSNLISIQEDILNDHMGFTYICDKKYLLTLMFLDSCVEPFFYDNEMNFYEDGHNYSLASLIYYTAPTFWGSDNYDEVLYLFQQAVKNKTDVSIVALIEKAKSLMGNELSENLSLLAVEYDSCINEIKNTNTNTDIAFVVLLSLITHIEKYVSDEYQIIHDRSKNLLRYNEIIKWFIGYDNNMSFQQTQITSLKFPLKLSGVSQRDSHLSHGVQLADILIGGMIQHVKSVAGIVEKNEYNQAIPELYGDENLIYLLPSLNFEESKQFRTGTKAYELIEFMAKNFI